MSESKPNKKRHRGHRSKSHKRKETNHDNLKEEKDRLLLKAAKRFVRKNESQNEGRNRRKQRDDSSEDDLSEDSSGSSSRIRRSSSRKHRRKSRKSHHRDREESRRSSREKRRRQVDEEEEENDDRRLNDSRRGKKSKHSRSNRRKKEDHPRVINIKESRTDQQLVPLGSKVSAPPKSKIEFDRDYFSFHSHLRLYLYRTSGAYFEDLTSKETHKAFKTFCQDYNEGTLEQAYYNSKLPMEALEQCKRTRHAWNFKTSVTEEKSRNLIKAGVQKQTEYNNEFKNKQKQQVFRCKPAPSLSRVMLAPRKDLEEKEKKKDTTTREQDKNKKEHQQRAMLQMLGLGKSIQPGQKITIPER